MDKERKILKNRKTIVVFLLIALLTVLLIAGIGFVLSGKTDDIGNLAGLITSQNPDMAEVEVRAMEEGPYGIELDSAFELTSNIRLTKAQVESALWLEPKIAFDIEQISSKSFVITPDKPFEGNQLIKMHYKKKEEELGWAFQTIASFDLSGTFPADNGYDVPLKSGVELYFTKEAPDNIEDYFEIYPETAGTFSYEGERVVFIPQEDMISGISYTVRLKAGYGPEGEELQKTRLWRFNTVYEDNRDPNEIGFYESDSVFAPDQPQVLSLWTNVDFAEDETVQMQAYRLESTEIYAEALDRMDRLIYTADPYKNLMAQIRYSATTTWTSQIRYVESYGYKQYYVEMAEPLADGIYLVQLTYNNKDFYHLVQVTPYQSYVAVDSDQLLCWVLDARTGEYVRDCEISLEGTTLGKTDEQGMLLKALEEPLNSMTTWYCKGVSPTGEEFVIDLGAVYYASASDSDNMYVPGPDSSRPLYWTYLYSDRSVYLPTDDIEVFGFVQRRDGAAVEGVTVDLVYDDLVLDSRTVEVSDGGTYSCSLKLDNFLYNYAQLRVREGEQVIANRGVNVEVFEKPAYKIETELSKEVVMNGDSIDLWARMKFFEGTPAQNAQINLSGYGSEVNLSGQDQWLLDCDGNGEIRRSFVPSMRTDSTSWQPSPVQLSLQSNAYQKNYYSVYDSFIFFPKDAMIEMDVSAQGDGTVQIDGDVHSIDISDFNGELYDSESYRGSPLSGKQVLLEVTESWYEPVFEGQVYDYINKESVDQYRYNYMENTVVTETAVTDSAGHLRLIYERPNPNRTYSFRLSTTDQQGRAIAVEEAYWQAAYPSVYNDHYYMLHMNQDSYKLDETVRAELYEDTTPVQADPQSRMLYIKCKDGFLDYSVQNSLEWQFEFDRSLLSNAYIVAVYFDGEKMYQPYMGNLCYDYSGERLNVAIKTDKARYEPGETVKYSIQVNDAQGNPVKSEVNLSVVDEAYFALFEDYSDPASEMYAFNSGTGIYKEKLFEPTGMPGMGAEKGGEGDSGVRSDFENTAYFGLVETGADGQGEGAFELPDNLTAWRITATAVNGDLKIGKGTQKIECGLPFFMNAVLFDTYLARDDIKIGLSVAGSGISESDRISYDAVLISESGETVSREAEGKAGDYINLPVGVLPAGNYRIKLSAKSADMYDGMEKRISVVESRQYMLQTTREELDEGVRIESKGNPVRLTFVNEDAATAFDNIYSIAQEADAKRLDLQLAGVTALNYLNLRFNAQLPESQVIEATDYFREGLFADMTYAEGSAETTAYVLLSRKYSTIEMGMDVQAAVVAKLNNILRDPNGTAQEKGAALWGLALMGMPVLNQIYSCMESEAYAETTLNDLKVYCILALSELGDTQKAKAAFDRIAEDYSTSKGEKWMLNPVNDRKSNARLMMAAALLGRNEAADSLYDNLMNAKDRLFPTLWEQLVYWMNTKKQERVSSFTYALGDVEQDVSLDYNDSFGLLLSGDEAGQIRFSDIVSDVVMIKAGIGTIADIDKSDAVGVSRSYSLSGSKSPTESFVQGDLVDVTLRVKAEKGIGAVEITDYLPAGLVYYNFIQPQGQYIACDDQGSRIIFTAYKSGLQGDITITYQALAVASGTYGADYVAVKNLFGTETAYDDQVWILIK